MINNFGNKTTQDVYDGTNSRYSRKLPRQLHQKAQLLLDQINAAPSLDFLRTPPGNHLEKINVQWRIVFRWEKNDAYDVRIVDYH